VKEVEVEIEGNSPRHSSELPEMSTEEAERPDIEAPPLPQTKDEEAPLYVRAVEAKTKAAEAKAEAEAATAPPALAEAPAGGALVTAETEPEAKPAEASSEAAGDATRDAKEAWDLAKAKTRLAKWGNAIRIATTTHGHLATRLEYNDRRLNMVLVTINAVISSSIFTSISDSPIAVYLQVFAGVLSGFAAVLTAWKTELKWAERSEGHRNAARGFEKISHRFMKQLDLVQLCPVDEKGNLLSAWDDTIKAWEELEAESPQISIKHYNKWDQKTRGRQVGREMTIININDLESEFKAKGKVTDENKKLLDDLRSANKNKDGIVEAHEMVRIIQKRSPK
jgi:hypothetical protein